MSALPKPKYTPEEYLALERQAEYKSQYFDGEIFAMAGGSWNHNLVVGNMIGEFRNLIKKQPCHVCPSDMKVKIPRTGLYTYPDVIVVCGTPKFEDEEQEVLLNPTLIVEVLSHSTEAYDRGKKFEHYRQIISLREYLLIAQNNCRIEHFSKHTRNRWLFEDVHDMKGAVKLTSIAGEIAVSEIYDKVKFTLEEKGNNKV